MNKTPVSILQELMVQRKECIPDYQFENYSGSPELGFKCTVKIGHLKAVGFASTKKDAKQNSAQNALKLLGFENAVQKQVFVDQSTIKLQSNSSQCINYVGALNEYASTHGTCYPNYNDILVSNGSFVTQCCYLQWTTNGFGNKKKDSKQDAARKMLDKLKKEALTITINKMESFDVNKIEKIYKMNEEILKNYEKLSSVNPVVSKLSEIRPIPNLKKLVTSMDELVIEMEKCGYKFKLETFQKKPYIELMKIMNTNAVLMGMGATREEARNDLFEYAMNMLTHGFSFSTDL